MASEKTLQLRAIRPRVDTPHLPQPNEWRRQTRAGAKAAGVSRRRFIRAARRRYAA